MTTIWYSTEYDVGINVLRGILFGSNSISCYLDCFILLVRNKQYPQHEDFLVEFARLLMNAGLYHPQIIFYMVSLAAQQASHGAKILHLIQTQP